MEAHRGAPREPTTGRTKRALDEVVPPEFVAREDEGGAYGLREMLKQFVHGYVADKGRALSDEVHAMELDDAQLTAKILRVTSFGKAVVRLMRAKEAARATAAAASASAGHSASSSATTL